MFKAVNLWAAKKCEEQGLSTDGTEKRRVLGERIVKGIRFPVMKEYDFAAAVFDCKILTPDEAFSVVKFFNSVPDTQVVFPVDKRTSLKESVFQRCRRFGSIAGSGYPYSPDKKEYLIFKVSNDNISLFGITLCGSENHTYSVTVRIKNLNKSEYLDSKTGTFSSVHIKSEPVSYYGFDVFFDRPLRLKTDGRYRIEASISGANSCSVQKGQRSVYCSGVRFDFQSSEERSSGTDVNHGQFPEFLFISN